MISTPPLLTKLHFQLLFKNVIVKEYDTLFRSSKIKTSAPIRTTVRQKTKDTA